MYNEDGLYEGFRKYGPKTPFNAPRFVSNAAPPCQKCGQKPMVSTGMCMDCETKSKAAHPLDYNPPMTQS